MLLAASRTFNICRSLLVVLYAVTDWIESFHGCRSRDSLLGLTRSYYRRQCTRRGRLSRRQTLLASSLVGPTNSLEEYDKQLMHLLFTFDFGMRQLWMLSGENPWMRQHFLERWGAPGSGVAIFHFDFAQGKTSLELVHRLPLFLHFFSELRLQLMLLLQLSLVLVLAFLLPHDLGRDKMLAPDSGDPGGPRSLDPCLYQPQPIFSSAKAIGSIAIR